MAWYDEAVFYHIYPLGLTGAPKENKDGVVVHRLEKLKAWIPHLKKLGINAIYIGPLFESSTHGYDTKDYRRVDSRLGDNNDFKEFVELAHDNGIKVVVDGVFNHTGRDFFAFQDILKNRSASPYCRWYKNISFDWSSPYNDGVGYEAWRGCYELVNLNPWEPAVREYIFDTIDMWIDEFDIDGIRLDCADCLEDFFIEEMSVLCCCICNSLTISTCSVVILFNWLGDSPLHRAKYSSVRFPPRTEQSWQDSAWYGDSWRYASVYFSVYRIPHKQKENGRSFLFTN